MKPSFLCIGAQKAATSWLYELLRNHHEIWLPPIKELHFFDHLFVSESREWTKWHIQKSVENCIKWHARTQETVNLQYIKYLIDFLADDIFQETWYIRAFDWADGQKKMLGDVTPEYCQIPRAGIQYVSNFLNAPQIIYIIRNPVDRAISQLKMNLYRQGLIENISIETWEKFAKNPLIEKRGDYKEYIVAWLNVFPRDQILFVPYRQCSDNPEDLTANLAQFLGVDNSGFNNKFLTKKVHETPKYNVPESVGSYFEEKFRDQEDFLRQFFGNEFFSKT